MKKIISLLVIFVIGTSLAGCADVAKQDVGTISGGVLGGLVGSRFGGGTGQLVAVGLGTVAGAFLGNAIGKDMDNADRAQMTRALENNSAGQPAYWRNANTGNRYKVTPTRNVSVSGNPYCREYRTTANVGDKVQQIYGTACRQPDGSWKVVK